MSFSYFMFVLMLFNMIASYEYGMKILRMFTKDRQYKGVDLFGFIITTATWNFVMSLYFGVEWV